jgi:hypothetical protein
MDEPSVEWLRNRLAEVCRQSLCEVLMNPATTVGTLNAIKESAKKSASLGERQIAVTIYFAAIASALVFHDQKISTSCYASLQRSFCELAEKPWMPLEFASLFVRASTICDAKRC